MNELVRCWDGVDEQLHYDANGNFIEDGRYRYWWDVFGRLRGVREKRTGRLIAVYVYDPLNRRMRKDVYGRGGKVKKRVLYVYDGWRVVGGVCGTGRWGDAETRGHGEGGKR